MSASGWRMTLRTVVSYLGFFACRVVLCGGGIGSGDACRVLLCGGGIGSGDSLPSSLYLAGTFTELCAAPFVLCRAAAGGAALHGGVVTVGGVMPPSAVATVEVEAADANAADTAAETAAGILESASSDSRNVAACDLWGSLLVVVVVAAAAALLLATLLPVVDPRSVTILDGSSSGSSRTGTSSSRCVRRSPSS
jgi:hypothetical protein